MAEKLPDGSIKKQICFLSGDEAAFKARPCSLCEKSGKYESPKPIWHFDEEGKIHKSIRKALNLLMPHIFSLEEGNVVDLNARMDSSTKTVVWAACHPDPPLVSRPLDLGGGVLGNLKKSFSLTCRKSLGPAAGFAHPADGSWSNENVMCKIC